MDDATDVLVQGPKREITIITENCESQVTVTDKNEIAEEAKGQQSEPFAKTIAHMKQLLEKKSAPMQKILDLN